MRRCRVFDTQLCAPNRCSFILPSRESYGWLCKPAIGLPIGNTLVATVANVGRSRIFLSQSVQRGIRCFIVLRFTWHVQTLQPFTHEWLFQTKMCLCGSRKLWGMWDLKLQCVLRLCTLTYSHFSYLMVFVSCILTIRSVSGVTVATSKLWYVIGTVRVSNLRNGRPLYNFNLGVCYNSRIIFQDVLHVFNEGLVRRHCCVL